VGKRIAAIVFIYISTAIAWLILGATIFERTRSSRSRLAGPVVSSWGAPQEQAPPSASWVEIAPKKDTAVVDGRKTERITEERVSRALGLEASRLDVKLDLEHRQKGLLWYATYKVAFAGAYSFRNASDREQLVRFTFPFPAAKAIYDDLSLALDGEPMAVTSGDSGASATARVPAGKVVALGVSYRSQGLDNWRYKFGGEVSQVRDFALRVTTNFKEIDFPENTLSPPEKRQTAAGWDLAWNYKNLISGFQIGVTMPEKLQPGPLAGAISLFAPVSLFFFFFLMFILTTLRDIELHPMNYFFLAAAFFAFHLLLAYLVDHVSIHTAFVMCSLVSMFLVVSYLRLVVGMRFAAVEAAATQFIYLILFSYAFFFRGFTGLTITIGTIATLFVVMQLTGRIRWAEKFARRPAVSSG